MTGDRRVVAVLFGGDTPEHEVSLVSARGVWAGFDRERIDPVAIAVDGSDRWLSPAVSRRLLEDGGRTRVEIDPAEDDGTRVVVAPGTGLMLCGADGTTTPLAIDAAFPVIHGRGGEDGRLQGLLGLARVPCVGAGVAGSAAAMDKGFARALVERAGVPVAPWVAFDATRWDDDAAGTAAEIDRTLGWPVFVKPANGGSSVGISKVAIASGLDAAVRLALEHDDRVVVERGLDAREIEVAVLGNERPEASVVGEIVPAAEFYTYDDKYRDGRAALHIPAPLPDDVADRIRRQAIDAYRCLDLAGLARVDFLLERNGGTAWFNEANTLPGFTPISMYSKLWEASGLPYPRLLERLVELAIRASRRGDDTD